MRHRGPLNGGLFERDGCFGRPTIWLSGNHDPFYDMQHRCDNFALFQRAGGLGAFQTLDVPGGYGNAVLGTPALWVGPVAGYLDSLAGRHSKRRGASR